MKQTVKLFIKNEPVTKPKLPQLELYLCRGEDGEVDLIAKDDNNCRWYVMSINPNGTLSRSGNLADDIGLQIDEQGKILEEK